MLLLVLAIIYLNHMMLKVIFGGAVSFASFLILTPFVMTTVGGEEVSGVLTLDRLGAKGMFIGYDRGFHRR